jgi:hypothetical protein
MPTAIFVSVGTAGRVAPQPARIMTARNAAKTSTTHTHPRMFLYVWKSGCLIDFPIGNESMPTASALILAASQDRWFGRQRVERVSRALPLSMFVINRRPTVQRIRKRDKQRLIASARAVEYHADTVTFWHRTTVGVADAFATSATPPWM